MEKKTNSGMRGVYLVAAELSRNLDLVVTTTARNGEGADILVFNKATRKTFAVQVKTNTHGSKAVLRSFWLTGKKALGAEAREGFVWVLVADHSVEHDEAPEFWVVPDKEALKVLQQAGGKGWPSIPRKPIEKYLGEWSVFSQ